MVSRAFLVERSRSDSQRAVVRFDHAEGNHGEDVRELYFYLDATPTHSYMRMLYKYPHQAFPYAQMLEENRRRDQSQPEFEILDTGVFEGDAYFVT